MRKPMWRLAALAALGLGAAPGAAEPPPGEALAREALDEARSMQAGDRREKVLRAVSRALRRRHGGVAMEAARAMSEPFELGSFAPAADPPPAADMEEALRARAQEEARCGALPRAEMSTRELEEEAAFCFLWNHCEPAACSRPAPDTVVRIATALPAGEVRRDLLLTALTLAWRERDLSEARRVLSLVRALRPQLSRPDREPIDRSLEDYHVDLLDGRTDRAIGRASRDESPAALGSLVALLVRRGEIEAARAALARLAAREACVEAEWIAELAWLPRPAPQDAPRLAALLDSLPSAEGDCPNGLRPGVQAQMELGAGRPQRALEVLAQANDPYEAARGRLDVAIHYLMQGSDEEARPLLAALADGLLPLVAPPGEDEARALNEAVGFQIDLIYGLAWVGEGERAAEVARAFPSAGWRAWGLALAASQLPGDGAPPARERVMQIEPADVPVFD